MSVATCHFYIVRHAQSEGNAQRLIQGHADFPLTKLGQRQARECSLQLQKINFDDCFSSDLLRTKETAEILTSFHNITVKTTELLREQNFGRFNGAAVEVFERELDQLLAAHRQLAQEKRFQHRAHPEIESDEEMMTRMLTFLRSTALAQIGKTILIVSHGSIMRTLLVRLGFATFEQITHSSIGNCGFIQLDCDGIEFFVRGTAGIELAP